MNRKSLVLIPLAVAGAVSLLIPSAQAASAHTPATKGHPAGVATEQQPSSSKDAASRLSTRSKFAKYQQVFSALLADNAGTQSSGTAACPAGTKLVGGGAVISSTSLSENLNSSIPSSDGLTWRVYVNNSSATNGTFRVYAVCVKSVGKYAVVTGTGLSNPAGAQTSATVTCPKNTFPLGGGGFSSSGSTLVNLNSSIPLSSGWRVDVNNASTGTNTATAYAVCGKKKTGYAQVSGTASTVNPSSQGSASVTCPAGTLVLSGGSFSSAGSTLVNLNSTLPTSTATWQSYESNGSTSSSSVTAYAVCAAAKA
jgi:hypothetical protein